MKNKRFTSTQYRITVAFTLLFLLAVILLASFLKTSIDAISYNAEARIVYAEVRQFYQAKTYLQQFERAINYYEADPNEDLLDEYNASFSRLQQNLISAQQNAGSAGEAGSLQKLIQDTQALRDKFDQVIAAARDENWEEVDALDTEAYDLIEPIFTSIDELIETRTQNLDNLRAEVDDFSFMGRLVIFIAVPLFMIMMGFVSLAIARQINDPLIRMTDELKQIEQGKFDPSSLGKLPERSDEIGYLAREYLQMAHATQNHQAALQREADEIRAKIR